MSTHHLAFWPIGQSQHLSAPQTNMFYNVEVSAARFPDKPYMLFYDTAISFAEFKDEAERIAGYLEQVCQIKRGDRVLLYMQNSPQFVLAYYGILRANAVVVPINPMNLTNELRHYARDTGARAAIVAQDLFGQMAPLLGEGLEQILVTAYSDYVKRPTDLKVPDFVSAPRLPLERAGVTLWSDMLGRKLQPGPISVGPDDLCVMPYTSGSTGHPKGCMHTHRGTMWSTVASMQWVNAHQDGVSLSVLPFFHVTGMQGGMNGPLYHGSTIVVLPRWDRESVAACIEHYRIETVQLISTMVVDLLANPAIADYDLSSLRGIRGGGAAMPEAVAQKLKDLFGAPYVEGYGLSETIAATHINTEERPKKQCLGIPIYDVDSRVVDPVTLRELPAGEVGEIVTHGPQVFLGYWNKPEDSAQAFIDIDGKRFFRTGDLGKVD